MRPVCWYRGSRVRYGICWTTFKEDSMEKKTRPEDFVNSEAFAALSQEKREEFLMRWTLCKTLVKEKKHRRDVVIGLETKERETVAQVIEEENLRFLHIRPYDYETRSYKARGGLTIAFHRPLHSSTINLSVASCSLKDNYSKHRGRYNSALDFAVGRHITLLCSKKRSPEDFLIDVFKSAL